MTVLAIALALVFVLGLAIAGGVGVWFLLKQKGETQPLNFRVGSQHPMMGAPVSNYPMAMASPMSPAPFISPDETLPLMALSATPPPALTAPRPSTDLPALGATLLSASAVSVSAPTVSASVSASPRSSKAPLPFRAPGVGSSAPPPPLPSQLAAHGDSSEPRAALASRPPSRPPLPSVPSMASEPVVLARPPMPSRPPAPFRPPVPSRALPKTFPPPASRGSIPGPLSLATMDPNEAADLLAAKLKSAPPPADTERAVDEIEEIDDSDATIVDMFDLGKTRERPKA